jgi:hypothetical protein
MSGRNHQATARENTIRTNFNIAADDAVVLKGGTLAYFDPPGRHRFDLNPLSEPNAMSQGKVAVFARDIQPGG